MSLEFLVKQYLDLSETEEYRKAKRIIENKEKLRQQIKKTMKEQNINRVNIVHKNTPVEFGYNIKYTEYLDTKSIPKEILMKHTKTREYWYEYVKRVLS